MRVRSLLVKQNIPESLLKSLRKFFHRVNQMEASLEFLKLSFAAAIEKQAGPEASAEFLKALDADVASRVGPREDTDQMMDAVLYALRHGTLPEA
jgi:hypothetical protein